MCQAVRKTCRKQQSVENTLINGEFRIDRKNLILQAGAKKFRSKSPHLLCMGNNYPFKALILLRCITWLNPLMAPDLHS